MNKKNARLEIRLTKNQKQYIKDTAKIKKMSITDYLIHCLVLDIKNDNRNNNEK